MQESAIRYFVGFMVTVLLLIILIILLFHSNSGKTVVPVTNKPLYDYASTGASVRMTIDGPTNADEIHTQIEITVNQYDVTYDQIQGYQDTVVNMQQFRNNVSAYSAFLRSLSIAGFSEGINSSSLASEQGHCPLGDRYVFELMQDGSDIQRYWTTNCSNVNHTYLGNSVLTLDLFEAQVPKYSLLVQNLDI
jgi:hypothetical protein